MLFLEIYSCNANINAALPVTLAANAVVTATATDPQGNTCEFSSCRTASPPPSVQFSGATYSASENAGTATITVTRTNGASGPASVNYATANGTAIGGAACGGSVDYVTTTGTLNWADGDSANKTFAVAICDDSVFENSETVNLTLTNASGATLGTPNAAVLTITNDDAAPPPPNAGDVIISEFRFRGPTPAAQPPADGALDEFIELYNATDANIAIGDPASPGWALAVSDGTVRLIIPNGTIIPARQHYLSANNSVGGYSLSAYAAPDATYTTDIPDSAGLALFRTASAANFNLTNRLDAVGFNTVADALYREGAGRAPVIGVDGQYAWVRQQTTGVPQDTQDNAQDFVFVSTDGAAYGGVPSQLGAPAPENSTSPSQRNAQLKASLIEPQQPSTSAPNRVRLSRADCDANPNPAERCNDATRLLGTLDIRRRFKNNTGQFVTALRFRIVDITTLNTPNPGGAQAELRLLNAGDLPLTTSLGNLTVSGTLVETPPTQAGGGLNSSATINLPGSIAPRATVDVRFVLGVAAGGRFRFLINVEAVTVTSLLGPHSPRRSGKGQP